MRRILIDKEVRAKLRSLFGVSNKTISFALCYRSHSDLARKIRATALQYGGKATALDVDTIYSKNCVIQRYGGNVELHINLDTAVSTLCKAEEEVKVVRNTQIKDLLKLQERANRIALSSEQ